MSEFLAEARILVRPDTTAFRAEMLAQLKTVAAQPIKVPVVPVLGAGFAAATAGSAAFVAAQAELATATTVSNSALAAATTIEKQYAGVVDLSVIATQALAASQEKEAIAATQAAAAQATHARSISQLARGAGASGLTLFGLRGATLAASGAFLAGTAAVVGFSKAVKSAADLETELNVFKVTAGATADQMDRVSVSARQLGRDITLPGVTAGDAATAMTELAKAGLSVQDALDAARGTLQLATAAQIDNVQATQLTAGALNSFGLAGSEAVKVADLLTGAAKESQGEITDMGTALAQASAVAHLFGVSIEDTVTLLTELAQAGIAGGRAGTSLRVAFLRLVNPPAAAAKALKELNVQIRDANGNLRPQVFTDIRNALQGYTKAQQDATLATIFGSDAIRTAAIIGNKGAQAFDQTKAAVTEVGLAQQQAAARTKGFTGSVTNLANQAEGLGLVVGEVAKGPLKSLVDALAEIVGGAADAANALVALKKAVDKELDFKIPGTGETGTSLGDKLVKGLFVTSPTFIKQTKETLDATILGIINDATDNVKREKRLQDLAQNGGVFGVSSLNGGVGQLGKIVDSVTASVNGLASAFTKAGGALSTAFTPKQIVGPTRIKNIIEAFDAQGVRAKIADNNAKLLDVLNTEQDFLEAQLQRQFVQRRPVLRRLIEQTLLGVVDDIRAIQSKASQEADRLKSEAKQKAAAAAQLVREQEQGLLAQFGLARDQQQNAIAQAALTQGLQDDVKAQQVLKALVIRQIAVIRERISVEGGRKAAIVALQAILTQISGAQQNLAKAQQQAQQQARDDLLKGIDLDITFAQITHNQTAEAKARQKKIAELQKELAAEAKAHGKTTLLYKDLRNQIAEEKAAMGSAVKEGQSFAAATFDFLRTQQGFASSLLGNLIPKAATTGLVGGSQAPVQVALQPVAGAAEARSQSGVTSGQGNATNHLLARILQQLVELNGTQKAPEANRQATSQRAVMDGVGGG